MRWTRLIKPAYLVLQDGSFYEGESFGSNDTAIGELVFNTSMTGYQEMLTDPSYSAPGIVERPRSTLALTPHVFEHKHPPRRQ